MMDETAGMLDSSDQARLYVLGLPETTHDDLLFLIFCGYGKILELGVKHDRVFGDHGHFAYVVFESADSAQCALRTLDGQTLQGATVRVRAAVPQDDQPNTVYVRDLPNELLFEDTLRAVFGQFGGVSSCILSVDGSGNKTGSAFIRFVAPVGCERALSFLTDRIGDIPIKYPPTHDRAGETVIQLESPLDIMLANHSSDQTRPRPPLSSKIEHSNLGTQQGDPVSSSKGGYGPKGKHPHEKKHRREPYGDEESDNSSSSSSTIVYAHNFPRKWSEDDLSAFFSRFGKVDSVHLQRDPLTGASHESGFVLMETNEDAQKAARKGTGETIDGCTIVCRVTNRGPRSLKRPNLSKRQ